jgi:hypothetical protein
MTDTKMYVPVQEHIRLMSESYNDGYEQALRDEAAKLAIKDRKTAQEGPLGPFWEAE